MNIEEIRKNAPPSATHYGDECYWLVDEYDNVYMWIQENGFDFWKYARSAQCLFSEGVKPL